MDIMAAAETVSAQGHGHWNAYVSYALTGVGLATAVAALAEKTLAARAEGITLREHMRRQRAARTTTPTPDPGHGSGSADDRFERIERDLRAIRSSIDTDKGATTEFRANLNERLERIEDELAFLRAGRKPPGD